MADPFGVAPRPFMPYGSRFAGDFAATPGMMFPGRLPQPGVLPGGGFGMMMAPGRPPFMRGMNTGPQGPGRPGGRPVGIPPFHPQNSSRPIKREQRASGSKWNDTFNYGPDQGKGQDMGNFGSGGRDDEAHYQNSARGAADDKFVVGSNSRNEVSDSEDEAPRRSRHGEGKKKKRRSFDGEGHVFDQ